MMKIQFCLFILVLISLSSCEQIIDQYNDNQTQENYVSPYKGIYKGSFSGSDAGILQIEVSSKDNVTITKYSNTTNTQETFYDGLIGGAFNGNVSPNSGFRLLGNLNIKNNNYAGTWKMGTLSGNWVLTKQ